MNNRKTQRSRKRGGSTSHPVRGGVKGERVAHIRGREGINKTGRRKKLSRRKERTKESVDDEGRGIKMMGEGKEG